MKSLDTGLKLRPYQTDALVGICAALTEHDTTLLCLPTGTGKTIVFAAAAKLASGRVMIIAHRDELITQAATKLFDVIGDRPDIEKAERYSNERSMFQSRCVVASVQTLNAAMGSGKRVERFDPGEFSLLVIDEAHHAVSPSYQAVIKWFCQNAKLKVLGVTATPDRADKVGMKNAFASVCYDYGVREAIEDGWLVPLRSMQATVRGMDLTTVRSLAGDFNQGELAKIMEAEKNLHAVASETISRMADRRVLVFCVSVAQSKLLAEILDRHIVGCARFISGETDPEERTQTLRDFDTGKFQILVNCMVATEGFDCPAIGMVVIARPTKSRALYAQMVGRGTRPLAGVVDGPETPIERKVAIANSPKADCVILDFAGNVGRHSLASLVDVLGGDDSPEVLAKAKDLAKDLVDDGTPVDVIKLLEKAVLEVEEDERVAAEKHRRRIVKLRGIVDVSEVEAFSVYGMSKRSQTNVFVSPLTDGQKDLLKKQGVPFERLDEWQQRALFRETVQRFKTNKCSFRQAKLLQRYGYPVNVSFDEARAIIDKLAANKWKA